MKRQQIRAGVKQCANIIKNSFAVALGITLGSATLQADAQDIIPRAATIEHNGAGRPCLAVNLDVNSKEVLEAFEDFMDDRYDVKMDEERLVEKDDLLVAKRVTVQKISSKALDFYAHAAAEGDGSRLQVFAALGYDIYIGPASHPAEYRALDGLMKEFMRESLPDLYGKMIKRAREKADNLADDRKDLQEEIADKKKEIKEREEEIKSASEKLNKLDPELDAARVTLRLSEERLSSVKEQLKKFNVE